MYQQAADTKKNGKKLHVKQVEKKEKCTRRRGKWLWNVQKEEENITIIVIIVSFLLRYHYHCH